MSIEIIVVYGCVTIASISFFYLLFLNFRERPRADPQLCEIRNLSSSGVMTKSMRKRLAEKIDAYEKFSDHTVEFERY